MPTDYNFTGQRLDRETGLLYYGARYYDPLSGRFTQADLLQNNVVGMDPYAYVGENPESRTDPTGQYFVPGGGNGSGSLPPRPTPPPAGPPSSQPSCTIYDCSVTLNHQTYSLGDILTDLNQRRNFLIEFYNVLATGFGVAELAFFDYLRNSRRLDDLAGYWNIVDFDLARDELIAAFDFTHHLGFQQGQGVSSVINNWLTFLKTPTNNTWWAAHNGSIDAGDRQERGPNGSYGRESATEQLFINETINVLSNIQSFSQEDPNLSYLFSPKSSTTGTLTSVFYPQQNNAVVTFGSFIKQSLFAGFVGATGGGLVGADVGGLGGAVGGFFAGFTAGVVLFQTFLNPPTE
jgi:RHS repeat-associated protein